MDELTISRLINTGNYENFTVKVSNKKLPGESDNELAIRTIGELKKIVSLTGSALK